MTLKGHETTASDHDWYRFKVTSSVLLHCHILDETIETSFYDGQPYVTLKDAVFENPKPLRHQVEKEKALDRDNIDWKPIECTFSDSGSDHNPCHGSLQMSQVAHFIQKDLDMSVAAVTYPGGSYVDPAERIMPLLNLALNGVSLSRILMGERSEAMIKNANSMEAVREKCNNEGERLKNTVQTSYLILY